MYKVHDKRTEGRESHPIIPEAFNLQQWIDNSGKKSIRKQ
jgi:hypothetical protein